jgi:hypothetical protein
MNDPDYTPGWAKVEVIHSTYDRCNQQRFWTSKFKASEFSNELAVDVSRRLHDDGSNRYALEVSSGGATLTAHMTQHQMDAVLSVFLRAVYTPFEDKSDD